MTFGSERARTYRLWAPCAKDVALVFLPDGERVPMTAVEHGFFEATHERIVPGQCYGFSLEGGAPLPDPRSQLQPAGVHGPSCWVDFDAFEWTDAGFQQVPLASALIYELHVGTFSAAGTFEAVIERLGHLTSLGVTHIELMPVAHFPGVRGWGYDGVDLFAPHTAYGGPLGLQRLVDACHAAGIAVLLDVVYNHLGPSGNYLSRYGPYFTSDYRTPWGEALNFDGPGSDEVRRFVCDNALHWLRNYHCDGLRLDAIHAIFDHSAVHVLAQLGEEVDQLSVELGRHLVVIAESGLNDARIVRSDSQGGYALASQWSDDFHHALHGVLTGERDGYYRDFGTIAQLAEVIRHGFVYRGQYSAFRNRRFGGSSAGLRGRQFVICSQNHDQVGNRAVGDRLAQSSDVGSLKIAAALVLLSPFVPMLFMGEEWGTKGPFRYFTDHTEEELAAAVSEGRCREFEAFGWDPSDVPDPQAKATFEGSKLDWTELALSRHREVLDFHAALSSLRRRRRALSDDRLEATKVAFDEAERWLTFQRGDVIVACNFADEHRSVALPAGASRVLLASDVGITLSESRVQLPPVSVVVVEVGA